MVGVGRAQTRDGSLRLRPRRRVRGMGMDDAADLGELEVEETVGWRIDRRSQRAFDHPAVLERDDDHIVRRQPGIRAATRLDHEHTRGAVDATGVAERKGYQPGPVDCLLYTSPSP